MEGDVSGYCLPTHDRAGQEVGSWEEMTGVLVVEGEGGRMKI